VAEKKRQLFPELVAQLRSLIERHKAGSPTDPNVYWIHLKPRELAALFFEEHGVRLSNGFIKRELRELGYRFRKMSKSMATGSFGKRDEQFDLIFYLVSVVSLNTPVISMDCKKKEQLGSLFREGKSYCHGHKEAYDHDYSYLGNGAVIPHGIYDIQKNKGYVSIGKDSETASFIRDNLLWWWKEYGAFDYPEARYILLLCDAGGGNSYRHHAFKKALLELAAEIGLKIIVAHYPPYSSKWNPIEHSLFCHIHRAMSGELFESYEKVKMLIEKTTTSKGLIVIVRLNLESYPTGVKTDKSEVNQSKIKTHPTMPTLCYQISS
jgi:Rhodopirellula transposase DDE domain